LSLKEDNPIDVINYGVQMLICACLVS